MGIGKGIIVFSGLLSLVVLGGLYFFLDSSRGTPLPAPKDDRVIVVTHSSKDGVQRYLGEVTLAHSCFRIEQDMYPDPKDTEKRIIVLKSVDQLMDMRLCSVIPTQYSFDVITESDTPFSVALVLDGKELPVRIREREWQNPIGNTVLDPTGRNK